MFENSTPDVLVVDVEMPKLDGLKAIELLKSAGRHIPILVFSADESPQNVRAALQAGAKGFLPKNAKIEELEFAIRSVMSGNTYLSPSVTTALMQPDGVPSMNGPNPLAVLTKREVEILKHLADGKPNRTIGKMLHISTRTVDTHRSNILKKLNVRTNAELVKLAIQSKLIEL
jgi:DNA-binding NarL/FixJ family response regulator